MSLYTLFGSKNARMHREKIAKNYINNLDTNLTNAKNSGQRLNAVNQLLTSNDPRAVITRKVATRMVGQHAGKYNDIGEAKTKQSFNKARSALRQFKNGELDARNVIRTGNDIKRTLINEGGLKRPQPKQVIKSPSIFDRVKQGTKQAILKTKDLGRRYFSPEGRVQAALAAYKSRTFNSPINPKQRMKQRVTNFINRFRHFTDELDFEDE